MAEVTLTLPRVEGGVEAIGDLWDCVNSAASENIFLQDALESHEFLEAIPVHSMTYELSGAKDAAGKSTLLDISVEIKFELGGTITVEGAASFTREKQKKYNEEEFMCLYNLQSYVVRTRPSVVNSSNVINQEVKDWILSGEQTFLYFGMLTLVIHASCYAYGILNFLVQTCNFEDSIFTPRWDFATQSSFIIFLG